jgi:hypothetical protein
MSAVDHLERARVSLAAPATAGADMSVIYTATARAALERAAEEIASLRLLLDAREVELVRRGAPVQLGIAESGE